MQDNIFCSLVHGTNKFAVLGGCCVSSHQAYTWQQLNNINRQVNTPLSFPAAIFLFTCLPLFPSLSISGMCWHQAPSLYSPLSNPKISLVPHSMTSRPLSIFFVHSQMTNRHEFSSSPTLLLFSVSSL